MNYTFTVSCNECYMDFNLLEMDFKIIRDDGESIDLEIRCPHCTSAVTLKIKKEVFYDIDR